MPTQRIVGTISRETDSSDPVAMARDVVLDVWRRFNADDALGLAAELSFRWLLALFPLAIMVAAMAGFAAAGLGVDDPTDRIIEALGTTLPPDAAAVVRPQIERVLSSRDGGLLTLGLALTVYAASAGMKALMKGLNRAYAVAEMRPLWRRYVIAIVLTLLVGVVVLAVSMAFGIGRAAFDALSAAMGLGEMATDAYDAIVVPLVIAALGACIAFLYRLAPARRPAWRFVLPGVILFVPAWLIATWGFSLYVADFGSYSDMYGALAGVVILLLWFYVSWTILLLGAELNVAIEDRSTRRARLDGVYP